MTSRDHAALAALAAAQQGCFHRDQATACGFDRNWLRREVGRGRIVAVARGVFMIAGTAPTRLAGVRAASLSAPGSIVSLESAAEVLDVEGMRRGLRVVTVPHGDHRRVPGVVIHQTRDPWPIEHIRREGMDVTTARRLLIDAAATLRRPAYRHLFMSALISGQTTVDDVGILVATLSRPGKRGPRLAKEMVDELSGPPRPGSHLEARLLELVELAALPPLLRQVPVPGRGPVEGLADGCWRDAEVIVEVDGRKWHAREQQMARDRERDGQAAEAGFLTHRVMYEHIVGDAEGCVARLRRIRETRLRQLGRSIDPDPATGGTAHR